MFRFLFVLVSTLVNLTALAQTPIQRMSEEKTVLDYAEALSSEEEQQIENKTRAKDALEIIVVLTKGDVKKDAKAYAESLSKTWNLSDTTFLILSDLKHINYGFFVGPKLKEKYPDWVIEKIEHNYIRPHFRDKKYYKGLDEASNVILALHNGSIDPMDLKKDSSNYVSIVLILIVVFFIIVFPIWQFRAMRNSHFSTKPMDFVSSVLLMNTFGSRGKNVFDDFTKGKGVFAHGDVKAQVKDSFQGGGGIAGSW